MSVSTIHVEPTATGRWIVRHDKEHDSLSEHDNATDAQRIACDLAHREGASAVLLHDRYARVHRVPIDCPASPKHRHRPSPTFAFPRSSRSRICAIHPTSSLRIHIAVAVITRERCYRVESHARPCRAARRRTCRSRALVPGALALAGAAWARGSADMHCGPDGCRDTPRACCSHGETTGRARHCRRAVGSPQAAIGAAPAPGSASLQAGPRRPAARAFNSVVCVVAGVPTDEAARYQAARLASPGGNVERVSAAQLTRDGQYVLAARQLRPTRRRSQCRGLRGCATRSHPDPDRSQVSAGNRGDGHDRRARRRLARAQRGVGNCRIASGRAWRDSHAPGRASIRSRAPARHHCERRRRSRRHRVGSARDRRAAPA